MPEYQVSTFKDNQPVKKQTKVVDGDFIEIVKYARGQFAEDVNVPAKSIKLNFEQQDDEFKDDKVLFSFNQATGEVHSVSSYEPKFVMNVNKVTATNQSGTTFVVSSADEPDPAEINVAPDNFEDFLTGYLVGLDEMMQIYVDKVPSKQPLAYNIKLDKFDYEGKVLEINHPDNEDAKLKISWNKKKHEFSLDYQGIDDYLKVNQK